MKKTKRFLALLIAMTIMSVVVIGLTACGKSALDSISVTSEPTKTVYNVGDTFDSAGMAITAKYVDGTTEVVIGYTITPSGVLTAANDSIRISYTVGGVTKIATQKITVNDEDSGGTGDPVGDGIVYQLTGTFGDLASYRIYHEIVMNLYGDGTVVSYSYNYMNDRMNVDGSGTHISAGTWAKSTFLGATNINMEMSYLSGGETKMQTESAPIASDGSISCSLSIPIGSGRSVAMSGSDEVVYETVDDFVNYCKALHNIT